MDARARFLVVVLFAGCKGDGHDDHRVAGAHDEERCSDGSRPPCEADSETETDTDTDADSDSDSDTDADSDADTDADSDADTDADSDSDADSYAWDSGAAFDTASGTPLSDTHGAGITDTALPGETSIVPTDTVETGLPSCPVPPPPLYLSADDSNSMSSPVLVRSAVLAGLSLHATGLPVRPYEFLNYYDIGYPVAPPGEVLLHADLVPDPDDANAYELQLGVSSESVAPDARPPINLTLVLDTSCSMGGRPLELLKRSCEAMASVLDDGDTVSMVTWNSQDEVVLDGHHVGGPSDTTILDACGDLFTDGGTDLHNGLMSGYRLAEKNHLAGQTNRVVLISDGVANLGHTDAEFIGEKADRADEQQIYLVGVGVGALGYYNDALMDQVTDAGKGAALYVDSTEEAFKMLAHRFVNTMEVAAREVEVRLDLPGGFEVVRFSGEEIGTRREEIDPQHLAPDDAMTFLQKIATTTPWCVDGATPITAGVTWLDPRTLEPSSLERTYTIDELLAHDPSRLRKGLAIVRYAEAALASRTYGRSPEADEAVQAALAAVAEAQLLLPGDQDLAEIEGVLELLP